MKNNSTKGKRISARVWSHRGRIAELFAGQTVNQLTVWVFDYFLYPFVVYKLGILAGGVVMIVLSFAACTLSMMIYDWSKRDWLGIEAIKSVKEYDGNTRMGRITAWIMKKSDPIVFIFLSLKFDPFITTVYLRHGQYNGMARRDWTIFMGSLFLSNLYWTLACYMGISLFEWGWKAVVG